MSSFRSSNVLYYRRSFEGRADPSGRAAGVHEDAYDNSFVADDNEKIESTKKKRKL